MKNFKIIDEKTTYISEDVLLGENVIIYPNVTIRGKCIIGDNTIIDSNTIIIDSNIGRNNYIVNSVIDMGNKIGDNNRIGPFSHLCQNNTIGNNNEIGSFVEIKNSTIGNDNFMKHLSYIGNTILEDKINLGAGVVFANFHSKKNKKYDSVVESYSSIGSNSTVVAPVKIGKNSLVGASSVVRENIDSNSLYFSKAEEVCKKNYYNQEEEK